MNDPSVRTLTVACTAGLSNRLRVLLTSIVIADATERQFSMVWPRTKDCSADYAELLQTPWPVQSIASSEWHAMEHSFTYENARRDLVKEVSSHLRIRTSHFLLAPDRYPSHKPLVLRTVELLNRLQPTNAITARIEGFQADAFRPTMIGVHLRRGDLQFHEPIRTSNTQSALNAVDGYLLRHPDAGILLCTDDGALNQYTGQPQQFEDVHAIFVRRYGERVVSTTPRSLDRRESLAIQDALVDLWLLRRTDCFVGTAGSSFSGLACLGRDIPMTMCKSEHPLRHLIPIKTWLAGDKSLKWLARQYWKLIRPLVAR